MALLPGIGTPKLVGIAVAGLLGMAVAGFLFAWSGLYSVAASEGHWEVVRRLLLFGMHSSVRTHALGIDVPRLDDPDLVRLGAGHFHGGCAYCHGAPGIRLNPIAEHMLPPPPPLSGAAEEWKTNELFWIAKHGIKYTGMPAWVAQERDDEVWAVVAFLLELPRMDEQRYRELALDGVNVASGTGAELARTESDPQATGACARCHGAGARGPGSALVPVLHGQSAEYLAAALRAYAEGKRRSGIMQPVAAALDEGAIRRVSAYYAGLQAPPSRTPTPPFDAAALDRGRALATSGVPDSGIPACTACHGNAALPTFPRLGGQPAAYLESQLRLWRRGLNDQTGSGAIMAPIAQRLSERQIADVAAYYASAPASPQATRESSR